MGVLVGARVERACARTSAALHRSVDVIGSCNGVSHVEKTL